MVIMLPCRCTIIKAIIRPIARTLPLASQLWRHLPNNARLHRFFLWCHETWITWHRRVFTNWLEHHCGKKMTIESIRTIWSKPLFAPCVALDQFNHDVYIFMVPRRYKPLLRAVRIVLCQLIMTSLAKHFTASQIFSIMLKNVSYSLDHCPQHHCAKKASIVTTWEQSVIVTSQLLVTGPSIDDVTIGQHFESFRVVTG